MPQGAVLPFRGVVPTLADDVYVADSATVIGDVRIGEGTGIWFGCVLRGDVNEIRIGARTNLQDGTIVHVSSHGQGTYVGDEVCVGHMALLHACTVESNAFVGMRACVMDDVVVEAGAMVAAGALVTPGKRVRAGELWAGSPAKCVRDVTEDERRHWDWIWRHYQELAAIYRTAQDV